MENIPDIAHPPIFYPAFLNLEGKKVVVVGGGKVALRKIIALLESKANVTVISPKVQKEILDLAKQDRIGYIDRPVTPEDLADAWLVIAATNDPDTQRLVFSTCESHRIFCNVVDEPPLCSFIVPSSVRRGHLCIAISTGGMSPALAKRLRQDLESRFGASYETFVELAGGLRQLVLSQIPMDQEDRKRLLSRIADLRVAKWIEQDRWDRILDWARSIAGQNAEQIVQAIRASSSQEGPN